MPARRLLGFILLNIVVSATVVLGILYWWDSRQEQPERATALPIQIPTAVAETIEEPQVEATEVLDEEAAEESDLMPRYTVQAGDTLGRISAEFNVPIADLLLMNNLDNPNYLEVGQELRIPVDGIPTETPPPSATPLPVLSPSPISVEVPDEGEAIIEIGQVLSAGDLDNEAVSIVNTGSRPIALLGWRLSDSQGHTYTFGQVTLFGEGAAIMLHTGKGQDGPGDLYWGFDEPVWEVGETVSLVDAEGTGRAVITVGSE